MYDFLKTLLESKKQKLFSLFLSLKDPIGSFSKNLITVEYSFVFILKTWT